MDILQANPLYRMGATDSWGWTSGHGLVPAAGPRALAAGGHDLAVMRTVARVGIDPPQGWERLTGKFDLSRREALRVLTANLPGVPEPELVFRTRCAAGLLNWLALAPIGTELAAMSAEQIERRSQTDPSRPSRMPFSAR